ncbi:metabolite traffic protein EboE [Hymenobacter sp. YC55]|uniref:metabolite traffic protein EboE n=1 Tax=Hymenobacter sp. YC55 TaxID=3034019 RepID=UPI0023F9FD71|nr:metabolite traffic protein EboE [Hymenobacter sp. YC55]MDF7815891.1 metabolite traffic protein EboE [Hymenobacter sp. YC55]
MNIRPGYHLTYCTNIHPGETWAAVFESLKTYLLPVRARVSPTAPFAVGLRLSDVASRELEQGENLTEFKAWLAKHDLYVPIINGFPFGSFHGEKVKDDVHRPDWTTPARLAYTRRLARLLAALLPPGLDGGISTSPLSYKLWHAEDAAQTETVLQDSTQHLAELVEDLVRLRQQTGQLIHLDIEPEPDGVLENSQEFINFYELYLLPQVSSRLQSRLGLSSQEATQAVLDCVQLCYDVCHFALAYEEPAAVFAELAARGIKVGRVQISAALKVDLPAALPERQVVLSEFEAFTESTYLHQVLIRNQDESITQYPDLPAALPHLLTSTAREWRSHFHVPVFLERYHLLQSTQLEIQKVLRLLAAHPLTSYLEVETYTWDVLPVAIKQDLVTSIARELTWVKQNFPALSTPEPPASNPPNLAALPSRG